MHFKRFIFIKIIYLICLSNNSLSENNNNIDLSFYDERIVGLPDPSVADRVNKWSESNNRLPVNPEELGSYVEGDILITPGKARNGLILESYRWPSGIVPFEIRGTFDAFEMDMIEKVINYYHENTCINFVPRTNEKDYISIQNGDSGCWSSVGRVGGSQIVNVQSPGCTTLNGTLTHELMHALGFHHEQNREERDDYVTIYKENIQPLTISNFEKVAKGTTSSFGVPYDYKSVMHYSSYAFTINNQPTILPKQLLNYSLGQRAGFSPNDILKINKMYNCKGTTASSGAKPPVVSQKPPQAYSISDLFNIIVPFRRG